MAAISSNGTGGGGWSSTSTWSGGVVPTSVDDVTINSTDAVTLDATGLECNSLTNNGTINASTTTNSDLTCQTLFDTTAGSNLNIDLSSFPSITCELILNAGEVTTVGMRSRQDCNSIIVRGASRKRWTTHNGLSVGATSMVVTDVTGWSVGDVIVFSSTNYSDHLEYDEITITSIVGNTVSWVGGTTYAYQTGGYISNMTSNVVIRSHTNTQAAATKIIFDVRKEIAALEKSFSDVIFKNLGRGFSGAVEFDSAFQQTDSLKDIKSCGFYDSWGVALFFDRGYFRLTEFEDCAFFTKNQYSTASYNTHLGMAGQAGFGKDVNRLLFQRNTWRVYQAYSSAVIGFTNFVDCVICGCPLNGLGAEYHKYNRLKVGPSGGSSSYAEYTDCEIRTIFGGDTTNANIMDIRSMIDVTHRDTFFNTGSNMLASFWVTSLNVIGAPDQARVRIVNKNQDVTQQEIYTNQSSGTPMFSRENTLTNRSTSSFKVKCSKTEIDMPYDELKIPATAGQTIRVIGYVQIDSNFYNGGDYYPPTVTLSGLGETDQVFTSTVAANGSWEQYDLSITNNTGNDGQFTLTYDVKAKTVTTGEVFFDGVPDNPFVTKCRHYGFNFNESSPVRVVDPFVVSDESTASTYTGVTINATTKEITFSAGTADTLEKFYDYSRYWAVTNLNEELPFTRAGNLFILTDGWSVTDPFYSGDLTWSSGTVTYTTAGDKSDDLDSNIVEYDISGGTITHSGTVTGTLDLRNLDTAPITVRVATGVSTTTVNNVGGTITVEVIPITYTLQLPNIIDGSRFQIYNVTTATELTNTTVSGGGGIDVSYIAGVDYTAGDVGRYRITYLSGTTAKKELSGFFTFAVNTTTNSLPVAQEDDDVYIANGIDGSTITKFTADFVNDEIDLVVATDFTATELYAFYVFTNTTATGIAEFFGGFTAVDQANYQVNTAFINAYLDNTTTSNLKQTDNIRIYRDDGAYPVKNPTTGGGGIDVVWRSRVFIAETGVSGLTPTESAQLAKIDKVDTIEPNTNLIPYLVAKP